MGQAWIKLSPSVFYLFIHLSVLMPTPIHNPPIPLSLSFLLFASLVLKVRVFSSPPQQSHKVTCKICKLILLPISFSHRMCWINEQVLCHSSSQPGPSLLLCGNFITKHRSEYVTTNTKLSIKLAHTSWHRGRLVEPPPSHAGLLTQRLSVCKQSL